MRERPILMSGPMVRAILEGRKTQTRRVMKPQPQPNGIWSKSLGDFLCLIDEYPPSATIWNGAWLGADAGELNCCPYGVPGDRLWVRETWQYVDETGEADKSESLRNRLGATAPFRGVQGDRPITWRAVYRADGEASHPEYGPILWRPSIYMPRWASRLLLEIKSVRVERLCDISEEDARAEGVAKAEATDGAMSYALGFSDLWDSIYAPKGFGWCENPWVWVVEFERINE